MRVPLVTGILNIALISQAGAASLGNVSFPYFSYLKSLFGIIVLLIIFLYVTKYMLKGGRTARGTVRQIEVLDRVQLEPQVALYLVRLKGKVWLISAGNKQTNVIDEVSSQVDLQDVQKQYTFKDTLDRIIRKKETNDNENT